jgi:hypothetical protein
MSHTTHRTPMLSPRALEKSRAIDPFEACEVIDATKPLTPYGFSQSPPSTPLSSPSRPRQRTRTSSSSGQSFETLSPTWSSQLGGSSAPSTPSHDSPLPSFCFSPAALPSVIGPSRVLFADEGGDEEERARQKRAKELEREEPLLKETPNRFTLFPIRYNEVRRRGLRARLMMPLNTVRADLGGIQTGAGQLLDGCALSS